MRLVLGRVAAVLHVTWISEQERKPKQRGEVTTQEKQQKTRRSASSSHKGEASTTVGIEQESMEVFGQILTSRQERQRQAVAQVAGGGHENSNRPIGSVKVELASLSGERDQCCRTPSRVNRANVRRLGGDGSLWRPDTATCACGHS